MRNRQNKFDVISSADFVLSTDDEKETDQQRWLTKVKHRFFHIFLLSVTATLFLFHTIRAYIPFRNYFNGTNFYVDIVRELITTRPITRVYTLDFRPNSIIENLFLRIAENWQVELKETRDEKLKILFRI